VTLAFTSCPPKFIKIKLSSFGKAFENLNCIPETIPEIDCFQIPIKIKAISNETIPKLLLMISPNAAANASGVII